MGSETILYYVTEESITGTINDSKRHFWQKITLSSFVMEKEGMTVIAVIIPSLKKEWKPEKLLKLMRETAEKYREQFSDAEIVLHPKVGQMLGRQEEQDTFSPVYWFLSERLLADIFSRQHEKRDKRGNRNKFGTSQPASVVLLLGNLFFPEEQMQKFMEWMQPYFPRINRLFILYDAETERFEDAIQHDTEELYYEYGLVSQIQCGKGSVLKRFMVESGQSPVLFMDCGYPEGIPYGAVKKGDFYLDIVSDEKKESLFRRKFMEISYISPRKYLDTLVKSGYDK